MSSELRRFTPAEVAEARANPTDKQILDWMQREGLESIVRVPQFTKEGAAMGIDLWASLWPRIAEGCCNRGDGSLWLDRHR